MHSINEIKSSLPSNKFHEFRLETEEKARRDLENFNIQHTAMLQTNRQNILTIARDAKQYIMEYDKTCKNTWLESKKKMYEREAADLRLELGIKKRHQIQVELNREKNEKDMKESIDAFELNYRRMGFQPQDWKDPEQINNKFTWRTETAFDQFTRLKTLYSTISYAKPSQNYLKTMHSKRRQDVLAFRDKTVRERVNNVIQKNAQLTAEEQDRIKDLLMKCNNHYKIERKNALEYQKQLYLKENERNKSIENAKLIQDKIEKENNEYYQQLIEVSTKKRIESQIELTKIIEAQNAKKELRNKLKHEDTCRFCEVMVYGLADLAMTCARYVENNKYLMPPVVWREYRNQYVRGIPFFEDSITGDLTLAKDWELILDSRTDYLIYRNNINDLNDSLIPPFILTDNKNDIFQIVSIICDILNQKWPDKPLPPVPTHPIGLMLIGPPLCGKSEICKHLAFQFYMRIINPLTIIQEAVKDCEKEIEEANKPKSPKNSKDSGSRKSSVNSRKSKSGKSPKSPKSDDPTPVSLNPNPTAIVNTPIPEDEEVVNLPPLQPNQPEIKPQKLVDIYHSDAFVNEYKNLIEEIKKLLKKPKKAAPSKAKKGATITEVIDCGRIEELEGYIQIPKVANVIGAMVNEIMNLPHGQNGGYVIEGNGLTTEQLMMITHLVSPKFVEKLGKGCETPELFIKKSKGKKFEYPKRDSKSDDPKSVWGENTLCTFGIIVLEEDDKSVLEERAKNLNLDKQTAELGVNPPPPIEEKTEEEKKKEEEEKKAEEDRKLEEERKAAEEEAKKDSKKGSKRTSKLPTKSKISGGGKGKEPEVEVNIPPPLPYIPYPFERRYEQYEKELVNYKNWLSISENEKDIKINNELIMDKFHDSIDDELDKIYKENTVIFHEQNPEAPPEPPPKDPTEGHDLKTIDGLTNYIIDMIRTERWNTVKDDPDKIPAIPNIMNVINENDIEIENDYCDILSSVRKLLSYIDERFEATEMKFLELLENKSEDLENVDKKFKLLVKQFYNNEISSDELIDQNLEFNHKEWVNAFNRLEEAKRQIPKLAESDWLEDVVEKIANKFGDLLTKECEHWMKMLNVLMNYFEHVRNQQLNHEIMMNSMPLIGSEMSQVSQTQSQYDGLDFCYQNALNTIEEGINSLMNSIRPPTPPPVVEEIKEEPVEEKKEEEENPAPAAVEETSTPLPTENEEKKKERSDSPSKNKKGKKGKTNSPRGGGKGGKKGKSPKGGRKSKKGKSPSVEDEVNEEKEEEVKTETPPSPPPPPPPPKPDIMEDDYNKAICEGYIQIMHRLNHLYETFKERLSEFENRPSDFAGKCYEYTKNRNSNESTRLTNFTNSIEEVINSKNNNEKKELMLPRYSLNDEGYYKLYTYQEKKLLIPSLENLNKYVDICLKYCDKKLLIQIPKLYSIISESIDKGILSKEWLKRFTPNEIQNIAISYDTHGIGSFYLGDYIHDLICCKYGIPLIKDILKAFSSCKATDSEMKGVLSVNQFKSTELCFKLDNQDDRDLLHLIYIKIFKELKEKENKDDNNNNISLAGCKVDYISYLLQLCHIEPNNHKEKNVYRHKGLYSAFIVLSMCGGYNEVINQLLVNKLIEKEVRKGMRGKVEDIWSELNANSEMLLSWMDLCDSNQFSWWAKKGMYIGYNSCLQH